MRLMPLLSDDMSRERGKRLSSRILTSSRVTRDPLQEHFQLMMVALCCVFTCDSGSHQQQHPRSPMLVSPPRLLVQLLLLLTTTSLASSSSSFSQRDDLAVTAARLSGEGGGGGQVLLRGAALRHHHHDRRRGHRRHHHRSLAFLHSVGGQQATAAATLDLKSVDAFIPHCAWQLSATGQTFPLAFPDRASIYQVLILRNLTSYHHVKVSSTSFPSTLRYWSLQTYDALGLPVAGRSDWEIVPTNGSNPYAYRDQHEPTATGTFDIYVTLTGEVPGLGHNQVAAFHPKNRSASVTCDSQADHPGGCLAVLFFRLYHDLDGFEPFNASTYSNPRDAWGGMDVPRVFNGNDTHGWVEVPLCSEDVTRRFTAATSLRQRKRFAGIKLNTSELANQANNFLIPVADLGTLYANMDATYTIANSHYTYPSATTTKDDEDDDGNNKKRRRKEGGDDDEDESATGKEATEEEDKEGDGDGDGGGDGDDDDDDEGKEGDGDGAPPTMFLLAKITGHLPLTPAGLKQGPRYVDTPSEWEVRYVSFSTVDMEGGKATLDGVMDTEIEEFYKRQWGNESWGDRMFTIIAAPNKTLATYCGLYDNKVGGDDEDDGKGGDGDVGVAVGVAVCCCCHPNIQTALFLSTSTPNYYHGDDPIPSLPAHLGYVKREILPSPRHPIHWSGGSMGQPATSANYTAHACRHTTNTTNTTTEEGASNTTTNTTATGGGRRRETGSRRRTGGDGDDDDDDGGLCYDPAWVHKTMGANYPRITYYECNVSAPVGPHRLRFLNTTLMSTSPSSP